MSNKLLNLFVKFSFGGFISAGISFFSTPLITALILPEEFGKASMFILAFNFILQLIVLGSDQSFVRFFYQDKFKDNVTGLLYSCLYGPFFATIMSISLVLIFWRYISLTLTDAISIKVVILLILTLIFGVLERFSTLLIRMAQKATLFSNLKIIQSLTNATIILTYAYFVNKSFISIIYGTLISTIVAMLIGIYSQREYWFKKISVDRTTLFEVLKYGFPFIPTFVVYWIFEGIDKMALRYYSNFNEIGLYTAASKIVAVLTIVQVTFSNFWAPIAYEAYEDNSIKSKLMFEKTYRVISFLLFIASISIVTFKNIIIELFSKNYLEAAMIMPFLVFIPIMYTLSEVTVGGINFKKKTYWHLIISLTCMLINVVGVISLVPKIGAKGAAISTGITFIVFFYLRTIVSNYYLRLNFNLYVTSMAIVLLITVALFNTFSTNQILCYWVGFVAVVVILLLYRKSILLTYKQVLKL